MIPTESQVDQQTPSETDANSVRVPSQLENLQLFLTLVNWYEMDRDHSQKWRTQAQEDFKFVTGDQWDKRDKQILESQGRPAIVFNRTLPIIKSVAGIEINSRDDTQFYPANPCDEEQVEANATLSAASRWMSEGCRADKEQSHAFRDCIISGMGWTEQRIDYDIVWNGKYQEDRIYPIEMFWDCDARKDNVSDARRMMRLRKMTLADAKDWLEAQGIKDVRDDEIDASWAIQSDAYREEPRPIEERRKREENASQFDPKSIVHLVHAQWIEREDYFKVAVPTGRPNPDGTPETQIRDMAPGQHAAVQQVAQEQMGGPLKSLACKRKVYKQAILGADGVLGQVRPVASRFGFTWCCITGEPDTENGTWFGIVSSIRDPQRWANKWLSQTLHILNSTAKGGVLAEADAFENERDAQETYARPDAITFVSAGALQKGKIMPKPGQGIPTGYQALLEFAISSIRDTTGINAEILGMKDIEQPGVLEAHRKQAAMTILATTFDSLKNFRWLVGRNRLSFIQDFFSDGRLIRVRTSSNVSKGMRLLQDKTAGDYEVEVADAPNSPNQKDQIWSAFQMFMPVLQPFMQTNPEVALVVMEYGPFPPEVVDQFRNLLQQAQQAPQAQMQQQAAQLDLQEKGATVQKTQADTRLAMARADHAEAQAQREHALSTGDLIAQSREIVKDHLNPPQPMKEPGGQSKSGGGRA
jgi:hypothetical protein